MCLSVARVHEVNSLLVCLLQLLEAMNEDSGIPLKSIQVDGGMTANNLLMQLQADLMGINVGKWCKKQYSKCYGIVYLPLSTPGRANLLFANSYRVAVTVMLSIKSNVFLLYFHNNSKYPDWIFTISFEEFYFWNRAQTMEYFLLVMLTTLYCKN